MSKKTYGLILPKQEKLKQQALLLQRKPIFDLDALEDDDDEDGSEGLQLPQRSGPALIQMKSKANNLAKKEIKKALEEDPSVFAYDEVYDDMKSEAAGSSEEKSAKKPKYMDNLLKAAELRKREKERREEKMIQKEREQEGDEFRDKEAFVTTAYKEKLIELRETEARERNEAAYEERLDVKKQQDLSGFYRHLLNQETGSEKIASQSSSDRFNASSASASKSDGTSFKKSSATTQRNLRKRNDSMSDDEGDDKQAAHDEEKEKCEEDSFKPVSTRANDATEKLSDPQQSTKSESVREAASKEPDSTDPAPEPKVDRRTLVLKVFEKRTVGDIFDDAVRRYREREQERGT